MLSVSLSTAARYRILEIQVTKNTVSSFIKRCKMSVKFTPNAGSVARSKSERSPLLQDTCFRFQNAVAVIRWSNFEVCFKRTDWRDFFGRITTLH